MKSRESAYNAKYWLHKFEEDLHRVKKFLENVDSSTPEFPFVEAILSKYTHKREESIARKKEYLSK